MPLTHASTDPRLKTAGDNKGEDVTNLKEIVTSGVEELFVKPKKKTFFKSRKPREDDFKVYVHENRNVSPFHKALNKRSEDEPEEVSEFSSHQ